MKFKFSSSIDIQATPAEIWDLAVKLEEWPQWNTSIKKIELLSEGAMGVGSKLRITARGNVTVSFVMTVIEFEPERRIVMDGRVLGSYMTRYYSLEPAGRKTRLTAGGEVSGLLSWLVSRNGQALSDEIVQSARRRIEGR